DNGADIAHIRVDGVAEHQQLEDGNEQREEQRRRVADDMKDFLTAHRGDPLKRTGVEHGFTLKQTSTKAHERSTKKNNRRLSPLPFFRVFSCPFVDHSLLCARDRATKTSSTVGSLGRTSTPSKPRSPGDSLASTSA